MEGAYSSTTTLIVLDFPPGNPLTLDNLSFSSTAAFRGIKFIGDGLHLFTYGLDQSELGMRTGFFFQGKPGHVIAYKWDPNTEQLIRVQEHLEGPALLERLKSIHPYLTTIPETDDDGRPSWTDLICYITPDILNRILPPDWTFTSQTSSTNDEATDKLSSLPSSKSEPILNFTKINLKRTFNPTSIGRELTDQILDKSYYLETLLSQLPNFTLLGEYQLSFLSVLYMNNFSGFETWKSLFTLFCGCKEALKHHELFFRNFLTTLRQQFTMCSEETFNEVILEGNFVADNLKSLNTALEDLEPRSATLEFSFKQLMALLASQFNWTPNVEETRRNLRGTYDEGAWDREEGDYAPVVVDIESDEDEGMDVDVDFAQRSAAAAHMDMKTGKMVFESRSDG